MQNRMIKHIALWLSVALILTGCGGKKEEEAPTYELKPLTLEELTPETYYIKSGEEYYSLPTGIMNWQPGGDVAANGIKTLWFGGDDALIPTMYSSDSLIYVTAQTITNEFKWTRFHDDGYTFGLRGLSPTINDKYSFPVNEATLYPGSSFGQQGATLETGTVLVLDKVNGTALVSGNIAPSTTVSGLQQNGMYQLDMYIGTDYYNIEAAADTHAFSHFEDFTSDEYSLSQTGYAVITVPTYFRQGYYMINDAGLFRYINVPKGQGQISSDFNAPYYTVDENGNQISVDEYNEMKAQEDAIKAQEEALESGDIDAASSVSSSIWKTILDIDTTQEGLTVDIVYSEPIDPKLETSAAEGSIQAFMTSPSGEKYSFTKNGTNTLSCPLSTTISPGSWTISLLGMKNRTFTLKTSFASGNADSFVHTGTGSGSMQYYLDKAYDTAYFTVFWDNTNRAGKVTISDPEGEMFGVDGDASAIYDDGYGYSTIRIPNAKPGNYNIIISGEELGRVTVTVSDQYKNTGGGTASRDSLDAYQQDVSVDRDALSDVTDPTTDVERDMQDYGVKPSTDNNNSTSDTANSNSDTSSSSADDAIDSLVIDDKGNIVVR